jgi:fibronectin type 3 domain-containing protein
VTTGVGTNGTVVTSAANPYIQTGLTDGTVYYYVVTAVGVNGESTPSPQVSVIPAIPVPPAPNTVTAVAGNSQMTISWQPVLGAASYVVYLSTTTGVTPANGYAEPSTSSTFILTGLSNGTTYYGVVTAVNASGASTASSQVSATPIASAASATAPVVTATPGDGQVNLTWTAVSGANSYNIYWSNTPGVTPLTGTQISGVNGSYPHTGLTNSKTYYYVVTAVTDSGESAPSSQVSAIPAVAPTAAAPAVVTVSPGTKEVTIAWTPVSGATSYNIYWSTTSEVTPANGTKIPLATNPYTQTGLNSGTTYYYPHFALREGIFCEFFSRFKLFN